MNTLQIATFSAARIMVKKARADGDVMIDTPTNVLDTLNETIFELVKALAGMEAQINEMRDADIEATVTRDSAVTDTDALSDDVRIARICAHITSDAYAEISAAAEKQFQDLKDEWQDGEGDMSDEDVRGFLKAAVTVIDTSIEGIDDRNQIILELKDRCDLLDELVALEDKIVDTPDENPTVRFDQNQRVQQLRLARGLS